MAIERKRSSQWIILTSSAVVHRLYDAHSSFQHLADRGRKFIYFLPAAIAVNSTARGPPISALGKYVRKVRVIFPEPLFKNYQKLLLLKMLITIDWSFVYETITLCRFLQIGDGYDLLFREIWNAQS
ncbi:MAG: hypothetical protein ACYS3S_13285 [Planctomycetota bacterium]